MKKEAKYLKTIRNPMSNNPAFLAEIDNDRRIWGMWNNKSLSFYFISNDVITDLHLTIEAAEALRLVIEKLQNEMAFQNYAHTFSTQGIAPKKKALVSTKKAGLGKKTKKQPSLKKKKK